MATIAEQIRAHRRSIRSRHEGAEDTNVPE
jgi:hypothetical protein